jgi:hypothetical protein
MPTTGRRISSRIGISPFCLELLKSRDRKGRQIDVVAPAAPGQLFGNDIADSG